VRDDQELLRDQRGADAKEQAWIVASHLFQDSITVLAPLGRDRLQKRLAELVDGPCHDLPATGWGRQVPKASAQLLLLLRHQSLRLRS
jgi:hypothetical protein